jgi:predicted ester cyclase
MAVIAEVLVRGVTREQYDAVQERVGALERLPDGALAHLTWFEDGDCHSVDAWESEEAFGAFATQQLGPALAAIGLADLQPEVTFHPAQEVNTARRIVISASVEPNIAAAAVPEPRTGEGMTSPAEARAKLRTMFDEMINKGNLDLADELFAEDYVDHGPMGDLAGRDQFKQLVAMWRAAVPDVHCEVDNIAVDGDLVAWTVRATGTHTGDGLGFPATGKRFETVSANLGRFRDGMAVEHWAEQGMFPMLLQIGVIPMPAGAGAGV